MNHNYDKSFTTDNLANFLNKVYFLLHDSYISATQEINFNPNNGLLYILQIVQQTFYFLLALSILPTEEEEIQRD